MIIALMLAAATPAALPDLDAALVTYERLVTEAARTGDTSFVPMMTDTVCRVAYRYTVTRNDEAAADRIIAYQGPNAERLKLSCSLFFAARS